jgi:hypothetical protein
MTEFTFIHKASRPELQDGKSLRKTYKIYVSYSVYDGEVVVEYGGATKDNGKPVKPGIVKFLEQYFNENFDLIEDEAWGEAIEYGLIQPFNPVREYGTYCRELSL